MNMRFGYSIFTCVLLGTLLFSLCASAEDFRPPNAAAHHGRGFAFADFTPFPDGDAVCRGMRIESAGGVDKNPYYHESLRLLNRGSFIEFNFQLEDPPADLILTLRHLASADASASNGGWSPISIYVNERAAVTDHSPAEHGFFDESWDITRLARRGHNAIRIVAEDLETHYWLQRIELAWRRAPSHAPSPPVCPPRRLFLDFSDNPSGPVDSSGMDVTATHGADNNPYYGKSLRLLRSGSYIEVTFRLDTFRPDAELRLRHLSSASANATNGGWSPVTVTLNGQEIESDYSPPEHGFMNDAWTVGEVLQRGRNVLRIQAEDLETHYWLQRIDLRP